MEKKQLTLFAEDSRARTYRWPESAAALLESGADYGLSLLELLKNLHRDGLSSKTSPVFCPPMEAKTFRSLLEGLPASFRACLAGDGRTQASHGDHDTKLPGGCLTLNFSESPNDAVECLLSDVLQTEVPRKYYLSRRAAQGILRRSKRRGKELPPPLLAALTRIATHLEGPEKTT